MNPIKGHVCVLSTVCGQIKCTVDRILGRLKSWWKNFVFSSNLVLGSLLQAFRKPKICPFGPWICPQTVMLLLLAIGLLQLFWCSCCWWFWHRWRKRGRESSPSWDRWDGCGCKRGCGRKWRSRPTDATTRAAASGLTNQTLPSEGAVPQQLSYSKQQLLDASCREAS